jgi:hypothetical protein
MFLQWFLYLKKPPDYNLLPGKADVSAVLTVVNLPSESSKYTFLPEKADVSTVVPVP